MRSAMAAALGLALVPLSQATNVKLPPCLDKFKPFVSSGCFQEGQDPTLIFRSGLDQYNMTVEKCVADCKGNGFRYAGLEYYGVCFCGATVNGPQLADSQCSLPCSGNKSEICGGHQALSVWQDPTFAKSAADVAVDDYKSLGCFTDDSAKGRALSWPVKVDGPAFTTKKCLAACDKGGFPFAGTEYGGECWCGVVLANDTAKVRESECNMPCRGDASDKCGGPSRLSLYVARDLESLEPCGKRQVTTTSSQAVITVTKPSYKFPNATTPVITKPRETTSTLIESSNPTSQPDETTFSTPVETVSTTAQETTSQPPETTTSSDAGEKTTTPETASTSSRETTSASTPDETTPAWSSKHGNSTTIAPGKETTVSYSKPGGPSETTKPAETTPATSTQETTVPPSSESSTRSVTSAPTSDEKATNSSSNAGEPIKSTRSEETTATTPSTSGVTTSATKSEETSAATSDDSGKTTASSSQPDESTPPTGAPITTTKSAAPSTTSSQPDGSASPTEVPVTTTKSEATSKTAPLCTATSSVPSRCEWQRGDWCAPPLPDWDSRPGCEVAAKTCALQVVSCFKYAGWPHAIDCFDFQQWCRNVQRYCGDSCGGYGRCAKGDCWSKYRPGSGSPPATTTSVFPCLPSSATNQPTSTPPVTSCPPAPSNICKQPSNGRWGYGPGRPVGGIPLPIVGCNDVKDDWRSRPYKLYTEPNSARSPSFRWPERPGVCADSCREQYQHCRDTYVDSCRRLSWKGAFHKRREGETDAEFARRAQAWSGESEAADTSDTGYCASADDDYSWAGRGSDAVNCWGWGGNTAAKAEQRCGAQYDDCVAVNSRVGPGDQCKTWCRGDW